MHGSRHETLASGRLPYPGLMAVVALRRGLMARMRLRGTVEVIAALALVGVIVWLFDPALDSALPAIVFGLLALAVRIAVAIEYVRCTEHGIAWRTIFASHAYRWDQVAAVEAGVKLYGSPFLKRALRGGEFCLVVRTIDGVEHQLLASIWCPLPRQGEFVIAAQALCPNDWTTDETETRAVHQPSGSRVGGPSRGRRR